MERPRIRETLEALPVIGMVYAGFVVNSVKLAVDQLRGGAWADLADTAQQEPVSANIQYYQTSFEEEPTLDI